MRGELDDIRHGDLSGCGTGEGGVARQDLAAVVGGERVEGAASGLKSGGVRLSLGEQPQGGYYSNVAKALGAVKQQQQQGQKAPQMKLAQPYRPSPIGLQQARAMFDPSQFYSTLQQAGIKTAGHPGSRVG
ncbi:hypothetical protein MKK75_01890 [Methylobacterium sp. J-030]|uniref:hypothetical protein n=1 Tax=Methylobacterium sp. J-030 TaxID=2836627 RepID=UPI001FBB69D0|nr:hypothetical protein [Methylobacterium sp. J-030]MCJ2067564.1 hypothetical protein [Methylobacterium sp. J-030]